MYSIGEMSERTGVKIPTIRFYEEKGMLPRPERSSGNQRRYDEAALKRLAFIRHGRDLGLSLGDIKSLLSLEGTHGPDLVRAHEIAEKQLEDVRDRIARLRGLEVELVRISAACDGRHDHVCRLLHAFGDHDSYSTTHAARKDDHSA